MSPPPKPFQPKRKRPQQQQPGIRMDEDAHQKAKRGRFKMPQTQAQARTLDSSTSGLSPQRKPSRIESLPTEILHMIASECTFGGVARLSRTSKSMYAILNDDQKQLWCKLLAPMFDDCSPSPSLVEFERTSRIYRFITKGKTCQEPEAYRSWADSRVVVALRLLINRAYANGPVSSNMNTLVLAVKNLGLFTKLYKSHRRVGPVADKSTGSYLGHVLLTLLHIGFDVWDPLLQPNYRPYDPEFTLAAFHLPGCYPLFIDNGNVGCSPSMRMMPHSTNLLLIANFFRVYLMEDYCSYVRHIYHELPVHLRPQPWRHQIGTARMLKGSTNWKGCSAYMDVAQVSRLRSPELFQKLRDPYDCAEFDEEALEQRQFFDLRLDFLGPMDTCKWYHSFESEIGLCREELRTHGQQTSNGYYEIRQSQYSSPFVGTLLGHQTEIVLGHVHKLVETDRISGFKRISFVTAEAPFDMSSREALNAVNRQGFEDEAMWVYEGVILPGDNMMIGRWWRMGDRLIEPHVSVISTGAATETPPSANEMQKYVGWEERRRDSACAGLCTGPFLYWKV